ncbi:DNA-binding response regulator [Romboutsia weinsteinii]|uniref:Stage 0 sporulation protein A homolog n=1 Tax=Romboutsia weinsteinii TaxID=2020949 RepID=A0A371IYQ8_9FIRM|nr:LytTR family DNA-binding domain-containing protein [Romboutsia weinsteinii]RDY25617.1 DNA-binding response regulator [Romboutsia weinsteinii]
MSLSIAICEDEKFYRDTLSEYICDILNKEDLEYELVQYPNGSELLKNIDKKFDILFLDIGLVNECGMDIARKIRDVDLDIEIIFTTSMESYVFEAYEVKAYRYLVKPVKYDLLSKHLNQCIVEVLEKNDMIAIKSNKDTLVLPASKILYIEVIRKHVTIYTVDKEYKIEISLKKLEQQLLNYKFFRCHNSYLVNLKEIDEIKDKTIILNGYEVPVSRANYKELQMKLAQVLGEMLYK